jgi:Spy/CpxP family protein refolding chaperone
MLTRRNSRLAAILGAAALAWLACPISSIAADTPAPVSEKFTDVNAAIKMMRADAGQDRRDIVAATMLLTPSEAQTFWPLYDAYRAEQHQLGDRKWQLIKDYIAERDTMTEDQAEKLRKEAFAIEKKRISIKEDYAAKMSKVLSARTVTRFFQIDNKFDAAVDVTLAAHVPLIK